MAQTSDELRLKVSAVDYSTKVGILESRISDLSNILGEYRTLKSDATSQVLGDNDDNIAALQRNIEANIQSIQGQMDLLKEQKALLVKQEENLGILRQGVSDMFTDSLQTAKSAFQAVKAVSDLTNMVN